jgi:hypothetical protein
MSRKCWICEREYLGAQCPQCGPPQPLEPTAEELAALRRERELIDTFDDEERCGEHEPRVDPQTGFVEES